MPVSSGCNADCIYLARDVEIWPIFPSVGDSTPDDPHLESSHVPFRSVRDGKDPVPIPNQVDDLHFLGYEFAFEEA
jgi:hypothetical protein